MPYSADPEMPSGQMEICCWLQFQSLISDLREDCRVSTWLLCAGLINIPGNMTESCKFTVDSDDGSLVLIDGKVLLSDTGSLL